MSRSDTIVWGVTVGSLSSALSAMTTRLGLKTVQLVDSVSVKSSITCGDFSEAMVQATSRRVEREGWDAG
jgi:hypothetical protein